MNVEKMAAQDAYDYALAKMFFGEGAGTRRKLVSAVVEQRLQDIPGYEEAFQDAFAKLSQIEMAERALSERRKIDRAAKAAKNIRAIRSGNLKGLSTGVFVVVGGGYSAYMLAQMMGYDPNEELKKLYKKARIEYRYRKARMRGKNVEKIFG